MERMEFGCAIDTVLCAKQCNVLRHCEESGRLSRRLKWPDDEAIHLPEFLEKMDCRVVHVGRLRLPTGLLAMTEYVAQPSYHSTIGGTR